MLGTLWRHEEGLTTVEYALLLALIAISATAAWVMLGSRVHDNASPAASSLPDSKA